MARWLEIQVKKQKYHPQGQWQQERTTELRKLALVNFLPFPRITLYLLGVQLPLCEEANLRVRQDNVSISVNLTRKQ